MTAAISETLRILHSGGREASALPTALCFALEQKRPNSEFISSAKNHGKTLLVTELVDELRRRGLHVGTIKHTHHRHELDPPGKDSHRHRLAGAEGVGSVSQAMSVVFVSLDRDDDPTACYRAMTPMFATCGLIIVEGDSRTSAPRIEVWRASQGTPPLAVDDPAIAAVVTDDVVDSVPPILSRAEIDYLADWSLERLSGGS